MRKIEYTFHGHVEVVGFWFDRAQLAETTCRERIMALWALHEGRGTIKLHKTANPEGYFLQLPRVRADTRVAPGLPIVSVDQLSRSAPAQAAENDASARVLLLTWEGEKLEPVLESVDPSAWFSAQFPLQKLPAFSVEAKPPKPAVEKLKTSLADVIGKPGDSAAKRQFLSSFGRGEAPQGSLGSANSTTFLGTFTSFETYVFSWVFRITIFVLLLFYSPRLAFFFAIACVVFSLLDRDHAVYESGFADTDGGEPAAGGKKRPWWRRWFGRGEGHGKNKSNKGGQGAREEGQPPPKRARQSWWQRLKRAQQKRLGYRNAAFRQLMGRRQARYLENMLHMFEKGDLKEALRHGVPLGGGDDPSDDIFFGNFQARKNLNFTGLSSGPALASLFSNPEVYEAMQKAYEAAIHRLKQEGDHQAIAYIYAELMNEPERALEYLNEQGEYQMAAELAELKELGHALQVRQWLLAKNISRAIAMARHFGCYAETVSLLESRGDKELAAKLRLIWAQDMARQGRFVDAVNAIWPVPEARALAAQWLVHAANTQTTQGLRMYCRWLQELEQNPERFENPAQVTDKVVQALAGLAEQEASPKLMTGQLVGYLAEFNIRNLAVLHAVRRRLQMESFSGQTPFDAQLRESLRSLGVSRALHADLPALAAAPSHTPLVLEAQPKGTTPIYAVTPLANMCALVAMGEAGVQLLNRHGKRLWHFNFPATELIAGTEQRALALVKRGNVLRVAELHLDTGRVQVWPVMTHIRSWANWYDGNTWFIATNDQLLCLDVQSLGQRCFWQVPEVPNIQVIAAGDEKVSFTRMQGVEQGGRVEIWVYRLPDGRLVDRREPPEDGVELMPDGSMLSKQTMVDRLEKVSFNANGITQSIKEIDYVVRSSEAYLAVGVADDVRQCLLASDAMGAIAVLRHVPTIVATNYQVVGDRVAVSDIEGRVTIVHSNGWHMQLSL